MSKLYMAERYKQYLNDMAYIPYQDLNKYKDAYKEVFGTDVDILEQYNF